MLKQRYDLISTGLNQVPAVKVGSSLGKEGIVTKRLAIETPEAILGAAAQLFAERGYDCTPIMDIADRAGVSSGTIIYHFKRKECLLGELALRYLRGLHCSCRERTSCGTSGLEGVLLFVSAFHDYLREKPWDSAAYFRNFPGERLKSDKDLGPEIAAAERSLTVLLHSLLQFDMDGRATRAKEVSFCARSIRAILLGGAFMIHFQKEEAKTIADDAIHSVKSLLARVDLSDRQSERGRTPCLRT